MNASAAMIAADPLARILIVEDDAIVALDLAGTLRELGYAVAGTTSRGEEAVRQANQLKPGLILMDVRLAGQIDGIQAAQDIRRHSDVPIIYLTAHSDRETLQRAACSVASGYLVKPFKAPELRCAIEIALHKHAIDTRLQRLNTELEQRVQERTAQLQSANQELESFSYSLAHDLRTPLRGIDSFSQLFIERYQAQLDETGLGYLKRVRGCASRMSHVIDAMLLLARIGRTEMQNIAIDFTQLIAAVAQDVAATHPDRQVEVQIEPGMTTHGDPRLLRLVIGNLLSNAWKFTSRRLDAVVQVGTVQGSAEPTYFVHDNGAGFDPAHAGKLFGAFQRLHTETEFPGTGIGLAIVQRVIARHGGTIQAESAPGQGATFQFTLPFKA